MSYFLAWNNFDDENAPLKEIVKVHFIEEIFRAPFSKKFNSMNWRHDGDCWSSEPTEYNGQNGVFAIFHENIWEG